MRNLYQDLDKHVSTHHKKVYKCGHCEFESEEENKVSKHGAEKHQGNGTCGKCDKFNTLERNYKLLKENYERLNTINKNVQDQAKDKQFAQDVQIAELRTNYDSVKAENIKIKDNLETQNKLWKIWLVKMDDKKDESEPQSIPKDSPKSYVPELEVEVINTEEDNDDTVNSEEIYQQFIKNKERGFKRTSPTTNPSPKISTDVKCETCGYIATNKGNRNDNTIRVYKIKNYKGS